jgi:hypothetical protein
MFVPFCCELNGSPTFEKYFDVSNILQHSFKCRSYVTYMLENFHLSSLKLQTRNETYSVGPIRSIPGPGISKMYNILSRVGMTIDGVLDSIFDLLTTYTHDTLSTINYSTTANLQNSQITTAPAKPFPSLLSSPAVP